jgi:hypothetical protein
VPDLRQAGTVRRIRLVGRLSPIAETSPDARPVARARERDGDQADGAKHDEPEDGKKQPEKTRGVDGSKRDAKRNKNEPKRGKRRRPTPENRARYSRHRVFALVSGIPIRRNGAARTPQQDAAEKDAEPR